MFEVMNRYATSKWQFQERESIARCRIEIVWVSDVEHQHFGHFLFLLIVKLACKEGAGIQSSTITRLPILSKVKTDGSTTYVWRS